MKRILSLAIAAAVATGCAHKGNAEPTNAHEGHAAEAAAPAAAQDARLPADAAGAVARLDASPRHGEYRMIATSTGDSLRTWVVYPERSTKAPVVVVVHEIFGLTNWVRAVADQLAAEGFIAVAPDLLTSKHLPTDSAGDPVQRSATSAIGTLDAATVQKQLHDVAQWGMAQPSALKKYGIVGFCWGGGTSFAHAVAAPDLGASVVYYGPTPADLTPIKAPVLGLYGGSDARISSTIPATDSAMKALHKVYESHIFEGAGHGFARQQSGQNGANANAIRQAWPMTIQWFHRYLGS